MCCKDSNKSEIMCEDLPLIPTGSINLLVFFVVGQHRFAFILTDVTLNIMRAAVSRYLCWANDCVGPFNLHTQST